MGRYLVNERRFDPVTVMGQIREEARSLRGARPTRAFFRPSSWPNVLLAALCVALNLLGALINPGSVTALTVAGFLIGQVPWVLLAWRPRLVEWLLLVGLLCWGAAAAVGVESGGAGIMAVAVYTIGTKRSWRRTVACLVAALVVVDGIELAAFVRGEQSGLAGFLAALALAGGVYAGFAALGLYMNTRRAYVRTLVERTQDLERERDLMAAQAVAVERARIARELHDVVAHHVSVMVIQAGAAQASLPPNATAAGEAIEAIRETGREAMSEMRRLLGLLRSEASIEPGRDIGDGARSPQPGVKDLEALAERTREAGVDVSIEISGAAAQDPGRDRPVRISSGAGGAHEYAAPCRTGGGRPGAPPVRGGGSRHRGNR